MDRWEAGEAAGSPIPSRESPPHDIRGPGRPATHGAAGNETSSRSLWNERRQSPGSAPPRQAAGDGRYDDWKSRTREQSEEPAVRVPQEARVPPDSGRKSRPLPVGSSLSSQAG